MECKSLYILPLKWGMSRGRWEVKSDWKGLSRGVQPFAIAGPHWKKKSCLGPHIKYIATCNHEKYHNVLSKFMILCWDAFRAILGSGWTPLEKKISQRNSAEDLQSQEANSRGWGTASKTTSQKHSNKSSILQRLLTPLYFFLPYSPPLPRSVGLSPVLGAC